MSRECGAAALRATGPTQARAPKRRPCRPATDRRGAARTIRRADVTRPELSRIRKRGGGRPEPVPKRRPGRTDGWHAGAARGRRGDEGRRRPGRRPEPRAAPDAQRQARASEPISGASRGWAQVAHAAARGTRVASRPAVAPLRHPWPTNGRGRRFAGPPRVPARLVAAEGRWLPGSAPGQAARVSTEGTCERCRGSGRRALAAPGSWLTSAHRHHLPCSPPAFLPYSPPARSRCFT